MNIVSEQPPFSRRLLDSLPFTIWSVDLDGLITAVNRTWSRFAEDNGAPGIAPEEAVIGCSIFSSIVDDLSRRQIERAMSTLRERRTSLVRWEFPCDSPGEERVFLMQVTAIDTDGEITGFVFSTVDITPSHRSREALINTGIALAEAIALDRVYAEVSHQLLRAVPSSGFVIALADDETAQVAITHRQGYGDRDIADLERQLLPIWLDALAGNQVVRVPTYDGLEITAPLVTSEGVLGALTLHAMPIDTEQTLEEAERVVAVIAAQTAVAIERAWLVRFGGSSPSAGLRPLVKWPPVWPMSCATRSLAFRRRRSCSSCEPRTTPSSTRTSGAFCGRSSASTRW